MSQESLGFKIIHMYEQMIYNKESTPNITNAINNDKFSHRTVT